MNDQYRRFPAGALVAAAFLMVLTSSPVFAAKLGDDAAFPETFMLRLASYSVQDADTDIAVLSSAGLGTGVSFADDLGGERTATIPRLDGYYRFNSRHRIDFASFSIDRDGRGLLAIDVELGDQTYSVGETLVSDISYDLFKLGYAYSFYHSQDVELAITGGLSLTTYEFSYERADGASADTSEVTGPLPMFGLSMGYRINEHWSIHYLSETFFIEIGDEFSGTFLNYELNLQYRFRSGLVLGAGYTRFSVDLTADDDSWRGRIADNHRGLLAFASYYF